MFASRRGFVAVVERQARRFLEFQIGRRLAHLLVQLGQMRAQIVPHRHRVFGEARLDALLQALDERPGLWMGCDVAAEGLYRRESIACAVPAVRFALEGNSLRATALTGAGGALLAVVVWLRAQFVGRRAPGGS